jgi:hypothetical protein
MWLVSKTTRLKEYFDVGVAQHHRSGLLTFLILTASEHEALVFFASEVGA